MAAKKANNTKTTKPEIKEEEVVNVQIETTEEIIENEVDKTKEIIETIEEHLQKNIETASEIIETENEKEKEFLSNIDLNQADTKVAIENEINRVDNIIKDLEDKMKNNKVFVTSTNWNGWGYVE